MAILMNVRRSKIFAEFTPEEQERYFSLKASKTLHHIDTFYYSITLKEEWVIENNFLCPEITHFLNVLSNARKTKKENLEDDVKVGSLSVSLLRKRNYTYCLSENELFDVFIAEELPNGDTPRIIVELRTKMLIERGTAQSVIDSFQTVEDLLAGFNIAIVDANESRIDYAYHTNLIQNPNDFFDDRFIKKHLKTNMQSMNKHLNPQKMLYNYISLGMRTSQNIFTRVYDKTREVVEMHYKNFFIERWRNNEMISDYDHWCLNYAYQIGSYTVGLLVARIQWYILHGKNDETKTLFKGILQKYDIDNSNSAQLKKICDEIDRKNDTSIADNINCLLPPVTVILNFEYETHRTFYRTLDKMIEGLSISYLTYPELSRIFAVLELHKSICHRLTAVGSTMSFVRDRENIDKKLLHEHPDQVYMDFWQRLRRTKIDEGMDFNLVRIYSHKVDLERRKREIMNNMAALSYAIAESVEDNRTYEEDFMTLALTLNDNDVHVEAFKEAKLHNEDYTKIRQRKKRQMRNIVGKVEREGAELERALWSMYKDAEANNRVIELYTKLDRVRRDILNRLIEENAEKEAQKAAIDKLYRSYSYKKRGKRALKEWLDTLTPEERKIVDAWIFQDQEKPPVFHENENPEEA